MPKSMEELLKIYKEQAEKIEEGEARLLKLFSAGVTVEHPLKKDPNDPEKNLKVTFKGWEDQKEFFHELCQTREYPLDEIGRPGNTIHHIKLFLFSKGYSPEDIQELMMNPDSARSKELAEQIRNIRQEFHDQVIQKDTDKISEMYVNAFRNLKDLKTDWANDINSLEKFIGIMPMLSVLSGAQSYWVQTNNFGNASRGIDREVLAKTCRQLNAEGIDYSRLIDNLQFLESTLETANKSVIEMNGAEHANRSAKLATAIHGLSSIPAGASLENIGAHREMLKSKQSMAYGYYLSSPNGPLGQDSDSREFSANTDAWLRGEEGAAAPIQLFEVNGDQLLNDDRKCWRLRKEKPGGPIPDDDVRSRLWKPSMEQGFRQGEIMDTGSVLHCIRLAESGAYDTLVGKKGEGVRMLKAMKGDLSVYDSLSVLSKAAVCGHLALEHPELFSGTAQQMRKAAEKNKLGPDNPAYAHVMEAAVKHSWPGYSKKIKTLTEDLSKDKLTEGLSTASAEGKKRVVKTLFLMQLGESEAVDSAQPGSRQPDMLAALAAGGTVRFQIPGMSGEGGKALRSSLREGRSQVAPGMQQTITYDSSGTMSVKLDGARGYFSAQDGLRVDLRGAEPQYLSGILKGLDEKLEAMDDAELDAMIGKLGGPRLDRAEMAEQIRDLSVDRQGFVKQNRQQMDLAAKALYSPKVLDMNDLIAIERSYSLRLEGELKYNVPEPLSTENYEKALSKGVAGDTREFLENFLALYKEQDSLMRLYADAAERMHRVREANENSAEPLANVRSYAQTRERELAEKYRAARQLSERLAKGINALKPQPSERQNIIYSNKQWHDWFVNDPEISRKVEEYKNKKVLTKKDAEAALAEEFSGFSTIDMEESTFREQQNLAGNKWTLLGVKYSNSDKYQDILNSMEVLKEMRGMKATEESVRAYQKEYEYLRDLCEDYIVSRRNPWTTDGKERKRMVTDVLEGMSNVTGESFERAIAAAKGGEAGLIRDLGFHAGYRKTISLEELKAREPERKERLKAEKKERTEEARRQQAAGKEAAHAKDTGTTERRF